LVRSRNAQATTPAPSSRREAPALRKLIRPNAPVPRP
jgi:hypothetical protein